MTNAPLSCPGLTGASISRQSMPPTGFPSPRLCGIRLVGDTKII
jgi:hypothetical protein